MATTVILPAFDPENFAQAISKYGATVLLLVPSMAIMILNAGSLERNTTSTVRRLRLTGAPSSPALLRRLAGALPGVEITNEYALTESTPIAITTTYDPARPNSVGRPSPGQLVRIVRKDGDACPPGEIGEVWLSSPGTPMRSYYRDQEATAATFQGSWLRTGDVGFVDGDGFLHLTDRQSDMIITGGRNVSCLEVEAVLQECSAIAEASVVGLPHDVLGEYPAAVVALRTPITSAELMAFVARELPPYAVPQTVHFVNCLPRGISGKVLKTELRKRLMKERRKQFVAPRTRTEDGVARIWARVLGVEGVSVNDRFVDLGGQSLSALQIITDIECRYGVLLEANALAEIDTVGKLASFLDGAGTGEGTGHEELGHVRTVLEREVRFRERRSSPDI
jgi:acyl-CoA synthetase (AMP-forming)/AMP-acid ligase II/acyl carrier protein